MDREEQIEEIAEKMQKCYEKNGLLNFKWFAEALYNAGYRKIDENCAVITKAELKEYKRQAVKEFAEKLKRKAFNKDMFNDWAGATYVVLVREIDELLKDYEV